jgi:uncharacterized SAM-binding protein YcdF (DUF218 family)
VVELLAFLLVVLLLIFFWRIWVGIALIVLLLAVMLGGIGLLVYSLSTRSSSGVAGRPAPTAPPWVTPSASDGRTGAEATPMPKKRARARPSPAPDAPRSGSSPAR